MSDTWCYLGVPAGCVDECHTRQRQVVLTALVTEGATVGALQHALAEPDTLATLQSGKPH